MSTQGDESRPVEEVWDMSLLYAEDLPVRKPIGLGTFAVTHDQIVDFARMWDPQPFHIDDDAAEAGQFGEVIASGVQSLAIFQRLAVLGAYSAWAVVAGRAIRNVELTSPLRPGMTVRGFVTVAAVRYTHMDRALVSQHGALSHDGVHVLTLDSDMYVSRRPR